MSEKPTPTIIPQTIEERANGTDTPAPRLARLELHGYKTFADKTEFIFPSGITAIVGPNGSGKSNIADALRWALGEQSFSLLRGKRTEDMIFSGSELRPRMGMASVSLTLDNRDGWLPVDFETVVITRRAYRSGENEYYLNGTRVRLRDIQEIVAQSGLVKRSYAIIGQGLVDQALSLRPEERRTLIEEAAGITVYQQKRDQALRRLSEVEANLVRVRDIVAEIAPRLKRLARQAERVERYHLLEQELKQHLRTWYGYRWHQGLERLKEARATKALQEKRIQERHRRILDLEKQLDHLRAEEARLREEAEQRHGHIATLHKELEALLREEAVARERRRGLEAQRDALLSELPALQAHLDVLAQRLKDAEARRQALEAESASLEQELAAAREAVAAAEARRAEAAQAVQSARDRLLTLTTRLAQLDEQERQVRERLARVQNDLAAQEERLRGLEQERARVEETLRRQRDLIARLQDEVQQTAARLQALETDIQQRQDAVNQAREALAQAQADVRRLQERRDLLERLREEGSGLYAGVRAVMQARLPGIVGVVAELLHVPPEYERAIEEALGASLQDVVVETWADAERAIEHLKRTRAGRATFLPLDTIRPPRRVSAPQGDGVIGLAADLVRADERLRPVVELLLNRTLVVDTLRTARRVLPKANGMRIVTLAGELVRSSGRVTGGEGKQARGGMLAREREWRELPAQIEAARARLEAARSTLKKEEEALAAARGAREDLRREHKRLEQRLMQAQEEARRHERDLSRLDAALEAQESVRERLQGEMDALREQGQRLAEERARLEGEKQAAEASLAEAQARLDAIDDEEVRSRLAYWESLAASLEGRRQSIEHTVATLREDMAREQGVLAQRQSRIQKLEEELAALDEALSRLQARVGEVKERLEALERPAFEAEQRVLSLEKEEASLEEKIEQERRRLHQEESYLAQATLAVQRAEDNLHHLRSQIEEDLGLVRLEEENGTFPAQVPLPFGDEVVALPKVTQVPADLEEDIRRLRIQLRNLGPINPDAPQEYEQLKQRHDFLQEQIRDLTEASADLKKAIADLDRLMQQEFKRTFQAVAREFKRYFERLFGGGTARLVLTNPDDLSTTGIDIVARPPGKRTQGLAMLSGGERALTAAALIFAILTVSPPPFCVLDEVDAALDEANVGRFRQVLQELARTLQFIVITHNRGTIEAANTIYGVSMGRDGVSKVLSLKLEEVENHRQ